MCKNYASRLFAFRYLLLSMQLMLVSGPFFQFPLPRDNKQLDMSRWHQNLIAVVTPTIEYLKEFHIDGK